MDSKQLEKIEYLFCRYNDGSITQEEMNVLDAFLQGSESLREKYLDYILTVTALNFCLKNNTSNSDFITDMQELAEYEKNAPVIEIPKQQVPRELIQKVVYPLREKRKVEKFCLISVVSGVAAVLFIAFFLMFAPKKQYSIDVATLTDTYNAKWADVDASVEKGTRIATGRDWLLREGYMELLFDNNARVTIEGPAEYRIIAEDAINLNYGKLYAAIPQEAIGFTVNTQSAKVIDLGTEFGVKAASEGITEVHMIVGEASLIPGSLRQKKKGMLLREGCANKIDLNGQSTDIKIDQTAFVRKINSKTNIIWRGENFNNWALIKSQYLIPETVVGGQTSGLTGVYHSGTDFSGTPICTRVDAAIDFECYGGTKRDGHPADEYFKQKPLTVRWTGQIMPPVTGTYQFEFRSDDGVRIWVDDQLVIDDWKMQRMGINCFAMNLTANRPVDIRIDYSNEGADALATLLWKMENPKLP